MDMIETLSAALESIADPAGKGGLMTSGRVSAPRFAEGKVSLILDVTGLKPAERDALDQRVHQVLEGVPGVSDIRVAMTAAKPAGV